MHWGKTTANNWEAKVKGGNIGDDWSRNGRHVWWSASLNTARDLAQEACDTHNAFQNGNLDWSICKAVVCWSTQTVQQEPTASAWNCQMRSTNVVNEAASYDWRVRTYLPEPCPQPPRYTGPEFVGAVVWGMNWGREASQKVWGPAGRRIWKKSTIQQAKTKAMENCRYHNSVVTGSADGAVCKAVVCWSTKTVSQEVVASEWACQLRGSSNHVADWTTAWRVRTYIPEACQRCANDRWRIHWGMDTGHHWLADRYWSSYWSYWYSMANTLGYWGTPVHGGTGNSALGTGNSTWGWEPIPVKGGYKSEYCFRATTINKATKQAKEACGQHNSGAQKETLCKAIVCWSYNHVQSGDATQWLCQMRGSSDLVNADAFGAYTPLSEYTDAFRTYTPQLDLHSLLDLRIQTYIPEVCS